MRIMQFIDTVKKLTPGQTITLQTREMWMGSVMANGKKIRGRRYVTFNGVSKNGKLLLITEQSEDRSSSEVSYMRIEEISNEKIGV